MKLSGFYKNKGFDVILKTDFQDLQQFEKVYISKVFTKTKIPGEILYQPNVAYGGTGFFYENAPELPYDIEHSFPDYSLYNAYVGEQTQKGVKPPSLKCYVDYSIGFLTRGCFRKCDFCVNKKYSRCVLHSPIAEFHDSTRKKLLFLDDNILAYPKWRQLIEEICALNKPFTFKQGIDIRLITADFAKLIDKAKYDKEIFFAFDNIADSKRIEEKLYLFREHSGKAVKMYVFCGYDRQNKYDTDFWLKDIESIFRRLEIIGRYKAAPYLMRYEKYIDSPFSGLYKTLATYCNVGGIFKLGSFTEFCKNEQAKSQKNTCARMRYYNDFVNRYPQFEAMFFNQKYYAKNPYEL